MQHKSLSHEDEKFLTEPTLLNVGTYCVKGKTFQFEVDVDACPLALLIMEAGKGRRVYELLTINRPGDLLTYLRVHVTEKSPELAQYVMQRCNEEARVDAPSLSRCELAFTTFDDCFRFEFDDTREDATCWLAYRDSAGWRQQLSRLLLVVRRAQTSLTDSDDFLVQHEIGLMAIGQHHLDFAAKVNRDDQLSPGVPAQATLKPDLFELIVRLSKQEKVRSVSCSFTDYWLWRELVAEQVRRSIAKGVDPMAAMRLNGPDSGIPFVNDCVCRTDLEWGGKIHIPYEGARSSDLFVQPDWRIFNKTEAGKASTLGEAVFGEPTPWDDKKCLYLLTPSYKLGEIDCANRTVIGGWALYEPKLMA